jgi:hypothetical protein
MRNDPLSVVAIKETATDFFMPLDGTYYFLKTTSGGGNKIPPIPEDGGDDEGPNDWVQPTHYSSIPSACVVTLVTFAAFRASPYIGIPLSVPAVSHVGLCVLFGAKKYLQKDMDTWTDAWYSLSGAGKLALTGLGLFGLAACAVTYSYMKARQALGYFRAANSGMTARKDSPAFPENDNLFLAPDIRETRIVPPKPAPESHP